MNTLSARGIPRELDAFLRPPARILQLLLGLGGSGILALLGWWWWVPVPLGLSFLAYEMIFASRADKPVELELRAMEVHIRDRFVDRERRVRLEGIRAATLVYRAAEEDAVEAVLVLADDRQVRLGLALRIPADRFRPRPEDVDADLCNAVLGSISGLIRALAPREALVRQVIPEPAVLDWFRERLEPAVWGRTAVRCWQGAAPELDLFGYHAGPPTGWIELEGGVVRFDGGPPCAFVAEDPLRSERIAVLFRMYGEEHEEASERLPMWIQPLGGRRIAIPAPLVDPGLDPVEAEPGDLHLHPPEGAVLLWHLWRAIPVQAWPAAWREAVRDARPAVERWPEGLPLPP